MPVAAKAARITRKAAPAAAPSKAARKPLTDRQRNLRSERTNIRLKGEVRKETTRVAGQISRENQRSATMYQNVREQFRTRQAGVRMHEREEAILHRYREGIGIRRRERLQRQLIEEPVVGGLKSSASQTIILFIMVAFGLIILYALVTNAGQLRGGLAGFTDVIANFTQTGPLFVKTPKE